MKNFWKAYKQELSRIVKEEKEKHLGQKKTDYTELKPKVPTLKDLKKGAYKEGKSFIMGFLIYAIIVSLFIFILTAYGHVMQKEALKNLKSQTVEKRVK